MKSRPKTFDALLTNWSTLELSAALGVPYINAKLMKRRKSVGVAHWPKLIDAAAAKGIPITADDLIALRAKNSTTGSGSAAA